MTVTPGLRPYSRITPLLNREFSLEKNPILLDQLDQEIFNIPFISRSRDILPREDKHIRENPAFMALLKYYLSNNRAAEEHIFNSLKTPDKEIHENNEFCYPVIRPRKSESSSGVIFLLHGLNERSWGKYLPWASRLAETTGKAVILFPLAFHMNRAPEAWSLMRPMMAVSRERKSLLPDLAGSSFANAAISYRMQFAPQRFILSGIQTFGDIVQTIKTIRGGHHEGIRSDASVDFFAYSIGATLAEVLLMTNPEGLLSHARAFLFCGGPALDLSTPINRGIIDNHGFNSIIHFFHDFTRGKIRELEELESKLDNGSMGYFKSLLLFDNQKRQRESRLNEIQERLRWLALAKDQVMTPGAIEKTLDFQSGDSPVFGEVLDFSHPYSHENPFNPGREHGEPADKSFDEVFSRAGAFLG